MAPKRKKLLVDWKLQGTFLVRTTVYWLLYLFTGSSALFCWMIVTRPFNAGVHPVDEFWAEFGPALTLAVLILPIVLFDLLRLTNKVAGPMYAIRREMRNLWTGEPVRTVELRTNDFGRELAEEFNMVVARVHELERRMIEAESAQSNSDVAAADSSEPNLQQTATISTSAADTALELIGQI